VYKRDDEKEWGFGGGVTDDGRYLIVSVWKGTQEENRVFYKDLRDPKAEVVKLIDNFDNSYDFVGNEGDTFFFRTNRNAPRMRVIAIDARKPDLANPREIIPQTAETLGSVNIVGDMFIASYMKDAHSQIKLYDMKASSCAKFSFPAWAR
jgi:prolyl oligopeptidase